jgi:hypothetical protein
METPLEVSRLPISNFIIAFIFYIAIHFSLVYYYEKLKNKLETSKHIADKNLEIKVKWLGRAKNFFPALYVIGVILVLVM